MRNFFRKRRAAAEDETYAMPGGVPPMMPPAISGAMPPPMPPPMLGPRLRPLTGGADAPVRRDGGPRERGLPFGAPAHTPAPAPQRTPPRAPGETELPRFQLPVGSAFRGPRSAEPALLTGLTPEVNGTLREAFTPTRPKQQLNALFVGRTQTLKRIISAIEEERAHVILFGDRGRGKTSLANAIQQTASQAGYLALKQTCSSELTFEDIFRHFLKKIPSTYYRAAVDNPFASRRTFTSFNELLPEGTFSVTELNEVLSGVQGTHALLILDEYDRVTDEDFRNKLAELFKNLTDSSIPVTLLVVGVAENLDQLMGKHPSIQRSLVPVHLPLMTDAEIERLIEAGAENANIAFAPDVLRRVADFACGLPYYAQLLGLHSARSAVSRGAGTVERGDLAYAATRCLQEAERGIVDSYNRALAGARRDELEDVLHAAALCPADEYGVFDPADLVGPDGASPDGAGPVPGFDDLLARLGGEDHGGVLVAVPEPGRTRYRFRNQMMRQYVLMRRAHERDDV